MSDSFPKIDRRTALAGAAAMGATLLWPGAALAARTGARERRDLFPEGVASGDAELARKRRNDRACDVGPRDRRECGGGCRGDSAQADPDEDGKKSLTTTVAIGN